jgi:hypothetical protein
MVVMWHQLALLAFLAWMPGGWLLAATKKIDGQVYAWVMIGLAIAYALLAPQEDF